MTSPPDEPTRADPATDPVGAILDRLTDVILAAKWPSGWPVTNDREYARALAEDLYDEAWDYSPESAA